MNKLFSLVENAKNPQIITNGDGNYVCAIWAKNDSQKDIIQATISSDFGLNWQDPVDLSTLGENAAMPMLSNDVYQRFISGIWTRSNGTNDIVQFSCSQINQFNNWSSVTDLSETGENASNPRLITFGIGKNILTIWKRANVSAIDIIQFRKSTDFGQTFSAAVDLSADGFSASEQQISTDEDNHCICTIWTRSNGTNNIIEFRNSSDFGENFNSTTSLSALGKDASSPQIKTTSQMLHAIWIRKNNSNNDIVQIRSSNSFGSSFSTAIDLSETGRNASNPQIASDLFGKKVYVVWTRSNGTNDIVQVSYSSDFGATFSNPPTDLSETGQNASNPKIVTDDIGQNIYVTWVSSKGGYDIIQEAHSNDFGATWSSSTDRSEAGQNAKDPQITASEDGVKTYIIWARSNGSKDVIQVSSSQFYGNSFSTAQTISK